MSLPNDTSKVMHCQIFFQKTCWYKVGNGNTRYMLCSIQYATVLESALYLSGYDLSCELSDLSPRKPITLKSSSSPHSKRWLHRLESLSLVSLALQSKYYWDVERKEKRSLCHTHANTSTCDKFLPVEFQSHFTLLGWAAELGHFVNPPLLYFKLSFFLGFISIPGASISQKCT